jgi:hypothetical protein
VCRCKVRTCTLSGYLDIVKYFVEDAVDPYTNTFTHTRIHPHTHTQTHTHTHTHTHTRTHAHKRTQSHTRTHAHTHTHTRTRTKKALPQITINQSHRPLTSRAIVTPHINTIGTLILGCKCGSPGQQWVHSHTYITQTHRHTRTHTHSQIYTQNKHTHTHTNAHTHTHTGRRRCSGPRRRAWRESWSISCP